MGGHAAPSLFLRMAAPFLLCELSSCPFFPWLNKNDNYHSNLHHLVLGDLDGEE
jgi:hypothetical protein